MWDWPFFYFRRPFGVKTSQNCCRFSVATVSIVFKGLFSDKTDETGALVVFWFWRFRCEWIFRNQLKMCPVSFSVAVRGNDFFKPVRTVSSGTVVIVLFILHQFFPHWRFLAVQEATSKRHNNLSQHPKRHKSATKTKTKPKTVFVVHIRHSKQTQSIHLSNHQQDD